jgi:hypothetical protein
MGIYPVVRAGNNLLEYPPSVFSSPQQWMPPIELNLNVPHFNVDSLVVRTVRRSNWRSVLTRSVQSVGIVCKDRRRPDEEEQGDGDDQRKGIQQVKVTLVGGEVTVVPVDKLGYSEDASSEVGDAGEKEDVVEGGPSVEESLAGRGVTGRPDHVTRATTASMANDDRRSLGSKAKEGIESGGRSRNSRSVPEPDGQTGEKTKRDDLENQPSESQLQPNGIYISLESLKPNLLSRIQTNSRLT